MDEGAHGDGGEAGHDLAAATAVLAAGDGRYTAVVDRRWEVWGPMGGYVAALALRAAGASSSFSRPASFSCHYLVPAAFAPVELAVQVLRSGRTAESLRVTMTQGDRHVLDALVLAVADLDGLEHDDAEPPAVDGPDGLPTVEDLLPDDLDEPFYPFWRNLEERPLDWNPVWPPPGPLDPRLREWMRFRPESTFDDPWVDAARSVILLDVCGWPAASRHHAHRWPDRPEWMAPNVDLYVAFHEPAAADPWLLIDGHAPSGGAGLIGWTGRVWSTDRRLVASGAGQLLCRPVPPPPPPG